MQGVQVRRVQGARQMLALCLAVIALSIRVLAAVFKARAPAPRPPLARPETWTPASCHWAVVAFLTNTPPPLMPEPPRTPEFQK